MPRSGGTMTIPNGDFIPGTAISSSAVDANFADIAAELTNSLALDGQSTMTGQLKSASGTVSAPGISFGSDADCGLYRIGANNVGLALNGAKVVDFLTTGVAITGTFASSGNVAINTDKFTIDASGGNTVIAGTLTPTGGFAIAPIPSSDDGAALGSTAKKWSDLFLASGSVINWNGGDVTLTHSANALAFAGASSGYTFDTSVTVGSGFTVSAGAVSLPAASVADAALATPGAWKHLQTVSASSSATVDLETGLSSTYDAYMIVGSSVKVSTDNVSMNLRVKASGTYQADATDYAWTNFLTVAGTNTNANSNSDSEITLTNEVTKIGNASGECFNFEIQFNAPADAVFHNFHWSGSFNRAADSLPALMDGCGFYTGVEAITGIRFFPSSGNIASGTFSLYGLKKS